MSADWYLPPDRRISRDDRDQRSSRSATGVPESERLPAEYWRRSCRGQERMPTRRSVRSGCGPVNSKFSSIWVRADGQCRWLLWRLVRSAWSLVRIGEHDQVRTVDLDDVGVGLGGHEAFQVRADRVVLGGHHVPGRDRLPGRGAGGLGDRFQAERPRLVGQAVYACAATYLQVPSASTAVVVARKMVPG
jgi:hypothetical protein